MGRAGSCRAVSGVCSGSLCHLRGSLAGRGVARALPSSFHSVPLLAACSPSLSPSAQPAPALVSPARSAYGVLSLTTSPRPVPVLVPVLSLQRKQNAPVFQSGWFQAKYRPRLIPHRLGWASPALSTGSTRLGQRGHGQDGSVQAPVLEAQCEDPVGEVVLVVSVDNLVTSARSPGPHSGQAEHRDRRRRTRLSDGEGTTQRWDRLRRTLVPFPAPLQTLRQRFLW